jgi:hypothetical protein
MNDRVNTCNKIHGQDLTLTFISRSHLGQKPVKTSNSLKICIINLSIKLWYFAEKIKEHRNGGFKQLCMCLLVVTLKALIIQVKDILPCFPQL